MNHAVIDLGANTIRLSIYTYETNPTTGDIAFQRIFTRKETAGLAGYVTHGILSDEGIAKAVEVLSELKNLSHMVNAHSIHVFATASLRNIENSQTAVTAIEASTGLAIDLLSGQEEAMLGFKGISFINQLNTGLMVDIGGASTEIVYVRDGAPVYYDSMPWGCLNLYLQHVDNLTPTPREAKAMQRTIKSRLSFIDWPVPSGLPMIGIGGTCRATLKLSKRLYAHERDSTALGVKRLRDMDIRIRENTITKDNIYREIYKVVPDRVLTLPAGLIILRAVLDKFDAHSVSVSEYGIREGYFVDRVALKGNAVTQ